MNNENNNVPLVEWSIKDNNNNVVGFANPFSKNCAPTDLNILFAPPNREPIGDPKTFMKTFVSCASANFWLKLSVAD